MLSMKISKQWLICFICFFPFLCPNIDFINRQIDIAINLCKVAVALYIIWKIISYNKLFYYMRKIWHIILFAFIYVCSTFINANNNIVTAVINSMNWIIISLLISYYTDKNAKIFLKAVQNILLLTCCINTLTVFLFPHGFTEAVNADGYMYFWGYDNGFIWWDIILITIVLLRIGDSYRQDNFAVLLCVFIILALPIFMRMSAGGMLIIMIYCIYFVIYMMKKERIKWITVRWIYYIWVFSILIVFFRIHEIFSWFITIVLHKDAGLSGRYAIWETAIINILDRMWIGHGAENGTILITSSWLSVNHCHNFLLNTLYTAGILGMFVFWGYTRKVIKKLDVRNKGAEVIIVGITLMFVSLITESQKEMIQIVFMYQLALGINKVANTTEI